MTKQVNQSSQHKLGKALKQRQGLFIVIEGSDGSGKGTQFALLVQRLMSNGYDVAPFDFPQYDKPSSYFVHGYLNGAYGTIEQVGPYASSLFYALDRFEAAPAIRQALEAGKIVLANRFTGSNMAHQGTKFYYAEERRGYFLWVDSLEFQILNIPRPDLSLILRVPADIAQTLVDRKEQRDYTTKKRDIHEADLQHLRRSVEVYDELCQLFPKDFKRVDCVRDDHLLDIGTIQDILWKTLEPFLPNHQKGIASSALAANPSVTVNPYIEKTPSGNIITTIGRGYLKAAVTDTKSDVYAFNSTLSPTTVAAAMARLSRRGDDMRDIILDEFAVSAGKDEKLLQRVITAYGDDSVQQLVGQHLVVENASNLLTKKLEWGRLAAYLEQSTRYIYYDRKGKTGNYRYYIPAYLEAVVKSKYKDTMDRIFNLYSEMVRSLTDYVRQHSSTSEKERDMAWQGATRAQACDAIRPTLPVATQSTVGIYASGQALESLIMHLLSDELPESHAVGRQLLYESRKVLSTFLERIDINERGVATQGYRVATYQNMKDIAQKELPRQHSQDSEAVRLVDFWPKNELDLLPDMLYEHVNLSLREIEQEANRWTYEKKVKTFKSYIGERFNRRHRPGRALEKAHYSWDLVCDYGIFRDLQRHRIVDDLAWQTLTPRYGYEIPELVEEAGLTEKFQECFEISLELYSYLHAHHYELEAQYATLLGHKMRWKVTYNAREAFHLHELRTSPQGHPGYRKLVLQMHEKLAEVHPLLAESMRFVNQGEDPELTRLAAERYTQLKLSKLK